MRNLKKFLALVLAMMMALSLMVTANAANEADNGSNKYPDGGNITPEFVEAVDVLNGMGIMTGDYGSFYADRGVMRSEMAAVLYRLMTGDTGNYKNELYADLAAKRFYDVKASDWFASYVGWCYDAGIMVGSGGYFRPSANVTGYETEVMVLRAMGYGKNHEYTGAQWKINASYDATVNGLLRDVVNTNYSSTLSANTRRDVVASIVFQAAQLPTVTWTPSLGYNKYIGVASAQGGNRYNPSLGETHFGLTCATGIVVGNQATGESVTKIGFASAPARGTVNNIMVNGSPSGSPNQSLAYGNAYVYASNALYDHDQTLTTPTNTPDIRRHDNSTQSFAWTTDLSMFNHAVKVWYRFGSSQTYALYDQATATAVVTSTDAIGALTPANLAALVNGTADADNNWDDTVMVPGNSAWYNYSFAAMNEQNNATSADGKYTALTANADSSITADNAITAVSPVKNNDGNTINASTQHPLYLLISNSFNHQIDVVISLDLTMTKVVQSNTTTYPYSLGVLNSNGGSDAVLNASLAAKGYFGVGADVGRLTGATGSASPDYVSLLKSSLLNTTEGAQKLGTKVAAVEITGTRTGIAHNGANTAPGTRGDFNPDTANTTFTSTFYYQLTEPTETLTAKVIKVDTANNDVYLEGGKVLHQSVYAEATDETFIQNANTARTSGMEGFDKLASIGFRLQAGRDYTFTLDAVDGNYIYWETPAVTSNFVYGTYIDWETKTASSEFRYPLVYVDTNGDQRQVADITSVDGAAVGTTLYDNIELPKRDSTSINSSGFIKGIYKGYALSSSGALTTVGTAANSTGFVQGCATDFGKQVRIDSTSVTLGAQATNSAALFLTENTQFYIVDGAGTENQTVTPYKGISELMKDMRKVEINGQYVAASTKADGATSVWGSYIDGTKLTAAAYEMFYYQAGPFEYDQSYAPSAQEVKTIYLPADCVTFTRSTTTSLVFVGESAASWYNANNGNPATQFTVYNTKGEASLVWIAGDYSTAGNDAYVVNNNGKGMGANDNVFYELRDSGSKATDGSVIYRIARVAVNDTAANNTVIGQYWDGTAVQWTTTTLAGNTNALYKATTYNQQVAYIDDAAGYAGGAQLYNVGAANIKNLNTTAYPGILDNNLSTLNGAGSLATNTGVPVSCVLNGGSTIVVDMIFVNA